jgi:hypothetical protein
MAADDGLSASSEPRAESIDRLPSSARCLNERVWECGFRAGSQNRACFRSRRSHNWEFATNTQRLDARLAMGLHDRGSRPNAETNRFGRKAQKLQADHCFKRAGQLDTTTIEGALASASDVVTRNRWPLGETLIARWPVRRLALV